MATNRFEELIAKSMGKEIAKEETPNTEEVKTEVPKTEESPKAEEVKEEKKEEVEKVEEVKEEVKEEVNSSLKEEGNTPEDKKDDAPSEEKVVTQQASFDELLSEKTDGKFKTYDELTAALSEQPSKDMKSFANEQIAKLNEYVEKGGNMEDFFRTQSANYDDMNSESLVKNYIKFQNPDLNNEDIDLLYADTYKLDEDEYTDKEIRLSKIKLKQKSAEAKRELMKFQKENALPEAAKNAEKEAAEIEAKKKAWSDNVNKSLESFKDVEFSLNDKGEKYTFAVNDETMNYVKDTSLNLTSFWNRYIEKDGTENVSKLAKEIAILNNIDSIVRNAYAQGKSGGKEDVIKDIKNPSYSPESKTDAEKPLSIQDQINKELIGR
tara:strand:+ start:1145 stop:2284 length:1140 start_codon:yes stop_codon:yes gene_type:complete